MELEAPEAALIASLRCRLAERDAQIEMMKEKKREELENLTVSFRAVIANKNRKIKDLEAEVNRLKIKALEDRIAQLKTENESRISNELKDLRNAMQRIEELRPAMENVQRTHTLETGSTSGTIRARFSNISKLNDRVQSLPTTVGGMNWVIAIYPRMDESVKYLFAGLEVLQPVTEHWSCYVSNSIKLMSCISNKALVTRDGHANLYSASSRCWGFVKFVKFEDLVNPSNNCIKEDSIIMEIEITVYPTNMASIATGSK